MVVRGDEELHGIQTWVGLPPGRRKVEPAFQHFPAESLPRKEYPGAVVRVIAGSLGELRSPVPTYQPTTYLDLALQPGARVELPLGYGADGTMAFAIACARLPAP